MFKFFKKNKRKIFIYSGAGISQESGLSTFRDKNGLWENHKVEEVCDLRTWQKNYELVHKFYNERRFQLSSVKPNKSHFIIAELQKKYGLENVINITTNVDDLFERANVKNTLYLHGKLTEISNINTGEVIDINHSNFKINNKEKIHKPNVVFFNQYCPAYNDLEKLKFLMNDDDILITIGMSFVVVNTQKIFSNFIKTIDININLDKETNNAHNFKHEFNISSSNGLKEVIKLL
jgi:NAD-dependent deacetylase